MKNTENTLVIKNNMKIILLFIIIILIVVICPNLDYSFLNDSKLYVTEIVASNTYTLKDNFNEYSDYIEIYNGYDKEVNLSGYHLSDSEIYTKKWTFPNIVIKPKEYLIIYASGKNTCDSADACHTNFKLSSKGESVIFTDKQGNVLSKITYPSLANDLAYGYLNGKYLLLDNPTPGSENKEELNYSNITNNELYINEYMIYNQRSSYNSEGNYSDFIELYNNSDNDLEIKNLFITDDINSLTKYRIPSTTIKKNDYLLIYLGDSNKIINNEFIADFKLSINDKEIVLSNGKDVIDKVEIVELIDNVSYGIKDGKWYYYTKPTPGYENNTKGFEKLGDIK